MVRGSYVKGTSFVGVNSSKKRRWRHEGCQGETHVSPSRHTEHVDIVMSLWHNAQGHMIWELLKDSDERSQVRITIVQNTVFTKFQKDLCQCLK